MVISIKIFFLIYLWYLCWPLISYPLRDQKNLSGRTVHDGLNNGKTGRNKSHVISCYKCTKHSSTILYASVTCCLWLPSRHHQVTNRMKNGIDSYKHNIEQNYWISWLRCSVLKRFIYNKWSSGYHEKAEISLEIKPSCRKTIQKPIKQLAFMPHILSNKRKQIIWNCHYPHFQSGGTLIEKDYFQ